MAGQWWLYALLCLLVLSACRVEDRPAIERPPLTIEAPATPVLAGMCEDIAAFEAWLQVATFQQRDFVALLLGLSERTRDEVYSDTLRMITLRDRVSEAPVPDCAVETHNAIVAAMDVTVNDLQTYLIGADRTIVAIVEAYDDDFQETQAMLDGLLERLSTQYSAPPG